MWERACVGAGLLAKAVGQLQSIYLNHCIREQARSHSLISVSSEIPHRYFLAMITARIGAGSPSIVLL